MNSRIKSLYRCGGAAPELEEIDFHVVLKSRFGADAIDLDGNHDS